MAVMLVRAAARAGPRAAVAVAGSICGVDKRGVNGGVGGQNRERLMGHMPHTSETGGAEVRGTVVTRVIVKNGREVGYPYPFRSCHAHSFASLCIIIVV